MNNSFSIPDATLKVTSKRWFPLVFLPIGFLFVLIYSYSTSPLYVYEGMDSSVFKTIGLAVLRGKTPYVDIFDHKGPILYFINALGQLLSPGRLGIFFLQVVWMFFTLFFLNKTARLFLRSDLSFIVIILSLFILSGIYNEGNQCEEWELPAITAGIYSAASFILYPKTKPLLRYSVIWGLCFGYIFFIRPNDAVSQIGGLMTGIVFYLVSHKDLKGAILSSSAFIGAVILVSLPIILFFHSRNAVPDLIYGMIYHNALYAGGIKSLFISCFGHSKLCFFLLFVPIGCMVFNTEHKRILYFLIPIFLLSLLLTGTNAYEHYYMVFIPLFLLFWVFLFLQKNWSIILVSLSMLYCCSYGSSANYLKNARKVTIYRLKTIMTGDSYFKDFYNEADKLVEMIPQEERNDVWNYNLMWTNTPDFSILYHNGIIQCNKVTFYPMYMVDNKLKELDCIEVHKPKWLFLSHDNDSYIDYFKFAPDYEYIKRNYTLIGVTDTTRCSIELYHCN